MEHIQHLDELVYTRAGRKTLCDLLNSIRNRDSSCAIHIEASQKYDGSPAVVFGKDEKGLFLSTKAFFNATPIVCYSKEELYEYYNTKVGLWYTLSKVWDILPKLNVCTGDIFQADVMFTGHENYDSTEDFVFTPNLIEYKIPAHMYKSVGLCVHTRIFPIPSENPSEPVKYRHIPFEFVQRRGGNDVFLVNSTIECINSDMLHGVAVSDALMEQMNIFEDNKEFDLPQSVIDTCLMLDNAIIRGEYTVTEQLYYENVYTQFVAARYAKDVATYKSYRGVAACTERFNTLMDFDNGHLNVLSELYKWRQLLRKFKLDLIDHFEQCILSNITASENEGIVLTMDGHGVVKLVNRESFSKRNFQKNGNSFQK